MSSCQTVSNGACKRTTNSKCVIYRGPNLPAISTYTYDNLTEIIISISEAISNFGTLTASNLGTGIGVFSAKVGNDFQFKTLVEGSNVTITQNSTEITIASSGSGGSSIPTIISVTSLSYTVSQTTGEIILLVDTSTAGGDVIVNIPTAVGNTAIYTVKKIDSGVGSVTIDPFSTQTIDNSATATILFQNTFTKFVSDNSNYKIIG